MVSIAEEHSSCLGFVTDLRHLGLEVKQSSPLSGVESLGRFTGLSRLTPWLLRNVWLWPKALFLVNSPLISNSTGFVHCLLVYKVCYGVTVVSMELHAVLNTATRRSLPVKFDVEACMRMRKPAQRQPERKCELMMCRGPSLSNCWHFC